jgi:acyl-CoA dehydrogenase
MVPNSLGPAELILRYGTEEQKNYYLPRLASGDEIPCFALTAPHAGSDASNIPDTGIVCKGDYNGKQVTGIRLNWDKRYITLAPIATVLGLAVHLYDPDHLLGQQEDIGITLCLIPTNHPGVEIGTRHLPLAMAFMNGPTRGENVFIPLDWIIGGVEKAGGGWRMLMECLSIGRSISLPALATASCKVAYRFTGAYARLRKQFNLSISSFEGIEEALGKIAGLTFITEASRIMTASAIDLDINPSTASAIAKYHMTEMGRMAVSAAMDVHAGHMVQTGPRNILANLHISAPISITVEGANILTRNLIIFGQGAIRCHPYLLEEIALMSKPEIDMNALDKTLMSHVGFFVSNSIRAFTYGITGGKFIFASSTDTTVKKYERQLTRMSAALAAAADTCLITLGGSLKRRERISARLGDILSQLYLASAALKYFNHHQQTEEDKNYLRWSLQYCLHNIQNAFYELFNNMPNRWLGRILKWCIFPLGHAYHAPSDTLTKELVTQMVQNSPLRDRLTQYCFISTDKTDLTNRLEAGLANVEQNDVLRKKLQKAVQNGIIPEYYSLNERIQAAAKAGVLSAEEVEQLSAFEALRDEIIKVNEFTFDLERVVV